MESCSINHCGTDFFFSFSIILFIHSSCCTLSVLLFFSNWVLSNSLQLHRQQHARLSCSCLPERVRSNFCSLSWWSYLTISASAGPLSFCLQSLPASGSFPVGQLFVSGGQSIAASASVFPKNVQCRFLWGLTGLISMESIVYRDLCIVFISLG